jgi:hypothetical protein
VVSGLNMEYVDKKRFKQAEIVPSAFGSVSAGLDGQVIPVTDKNGTHLFVRIGGSLVPATDVTKVLDGDRTGFVRMTVDAATGVSPPEGTVIYSQADYDAFGAPLLYPQDAIDILPPIRNFTPVISVAGGTYLSRPPRNAYDYSELFNLENRVFSGRHRGYDVDYNFSGIIYVTGLDNTLVYSTISGTASGYTITRASGTWVAGELRGKFALIISGPGAGSKFVIDNNTTNVLTIAGWPLTGGSVTFQIVVPAAIFMPSSDGVSEDSNSLNLTSPELVFFTNITVGSPTLRTTLTCSYTKSPIYLIDSVFNLGGYSEFAGRVSGTVCFSNCYVRAVAKYGFLFELAPNGAVESSVYEGSVTSVSNRYFGPVISVIGCKDFSVYYSTFKSLGSNADKLIVAQNGSMVRFGGTCSFKGNSNSTCLAVFGETDGFR